MRYVFGLRVKHVVLKELLPHLTLFCGQVTQAKYPVLQNIERAAEIIGSAAPPVIYKHVEIF